jgi:hypothetical protein
MASITKLPLDFKGTLTSNYRSGEEHTLTKANGRVNRMFTPDFGAFYTESLVVRQSDGQLLVRDKDYVLTYFYKDLGDVTAKEICAIIVVTNPVVTATVRITYQAVGGPYALSIKELKAVLDETELAPGKIKWEDIIDKPLAYNPDDHAHEYWQLYGLESTNFNLDALGKAWAKGRKAIIGDNRIYYQNYIILAQAAVDAYRLKVNAHIVDRANPHKTDKIKIQLGNVNNWPLADTATSTSKTVNNKYQPIGGIYNQLVTHVVPLLNAHVNNMANPHQVQLTDPLLNLYSSQQIRDIFNLHLAKTQMANDSAKFAGFPATTVFNNIRTGLDASNVDPNTRFPEAMFGPTVPGWDPGQWILAGNQRYAYIQDILKPYNDLAGTVYFVGSSGDVTTIQSAYNAIQIASNNPEINVNAWLIGQYAYDYVAGLRNVSLVVAQKTGPGTWAIRV